MSCCKKSQRVLPKCNDVVLFALKFCRTDIMRIIRHCKPIWCYLDETSVYLRLVSNKHICTLRLLIFLLWAIHNEHSKWRLISSTFIASEESLLSSCLHSKVNNVQHMSICKLLMGDTHWSFSVCSCHAYIVFSVSLRNMMLRAIYGVLGLQLCIA